MDIVRSLSDGYTYKEIGIFLGLSPRTIEHSLQLAFKLYGCKNSAHLVAYFIRNGIIN